MPAYFCSTATFHLIATYAATVDPSAQIAAVWRQLIAENLRSLNHRCPYDQPDNVKTAAAELAAITDRPMLPLPAPGIIKSALNEYGYQSCEHDGYSSSPAGLLVTRLLATIPEPRAEHPAGWYPVEELPQAQPVAVAAPAPEPTPAADPIEAARAKLAAAFQAPAAPEPEPAPESPEPTGLAALPAATRRTAHAMLSTLARASADHPDGARFAELADRVGATLSGLERADSHVQASANAAALRAVLDAAREAE